MSLFSVRTLLGFTKQNFCVLPTATRFLSSKSRKEKWDLVAAACLERKPIISKEMNTEEKKFSDLLKQIEYEKSFQSDHELRHKQDKKQVEVLRRGEETDVEQSLKQTAQDFEDACQEEINKFQFSSRTTIADETNYMKALDRRQSDSLLLVVEQKLGENYKWALPQGSRVDGETLRQTAERVLKENCGSELKVKFLGNVPCGFYKYKYPRHKKEMAFGAKVFFFKAQYLQGQVGENKLNINDFKWLLHDELEASLTKDYYNSVSQFLV